MPHPGCIPIFTCVSAKEACSDAIRKSQFSASSNPPVMAGPFIAPMIGLSHAASTSESPFPSPRGSIRLSVAIAFRSSPEQKAVPAPVSTAARISMSDATVSMQSYRFFNRSWFSALRRSGRFSVMSATPFSFSNNTVFSMRVPLSVRLY